MNAFGAVARPFARVARLPILAPLLGRDFRLVWFGEGVSLLGDQFHLIALSWLVLDLTGSGLALGSILIAGSIPRGAFMLFGGVLSDRFSPRDLALVSDVVRCILTTVIAALVLGAQVELWQLAAVGVAFGTVDAVFLPAINTLVPRLVPPDHLAAANAVMQGTAQLTGTVGPALAGFAVALIGVGAAFAFDALTFAVAAVSLWLVRSGARPGHATDASGDPAPDPPMPIDQPATLTGSGARQSVLRDLVAGAREILGDPVMRSIVIVSIAANLAFTGQLVVGLPWLVLVRFGADASALGLLYAAWGAGSVGGVLAAGSMKRPERFGSIVIGLLSAMGIGLAAIGIAPNLALIGVIALALGATNGYINVVVIAWVQGRTDPAMLGRTMSFLMLGSVVAAPLSLAIAAVVVDSHATALFVGAGLLLVASGGIAFASGLQRKMI
ncbi:MAG TPA: MFS transporter [Candidatus Limnocylindrales bacterium]|nr:MFS transporter [Candidatus Limnocylindrales bacterium]